MSTRARVDRRTVAFLGIAFGAVLALCLPALLGVDADYLGVATPFAQWIPAVAVVLAVRPARGSRQLRRLWRTAPFGGARTGIVLGLATLAVVGVAGVQMAVGVLTGVVSWAPAPGLGATALLVLPVALLAFVSATGEEFGWRGFLWTRLRSGGGFWLTALVVGAIWAAWHLPLLLAYGAQGDLPWRVVIGTTIDLVAASLVLGAGRELSGSVWPASWGHALLNSALVFASTGFVTPESALSEPAFWGWKALGWAAWVGAAAGLLALRRVRTVGPVRDSTGRSLDETHDALLDAMRASDVDTLRLLLADDLRFRLPDGSTIGRSADLETHATGAVRFLRIEEIERESAEKGGRGRTTARTHVELVDGGRYVEATMVYERSWAIVGGRWQVVEGSATVAAGAEAGAGATPPPPG